MKIYNNKRSYRSFEDGICTTFVEQLDWLIKTDKRLKGLFYFHIPNGGSRDIMEAFKFQKLGVKKGVADYLVMRAAGGYNGLFLEFKFTGNKIEKNYKNKLSESQEVFFDIAKQENYKAVVVTTADEGVNAIYEYLEGE